MQVFKAYFKIIKKNSPQMLIYIIIFLAFSVAFISIGTQKQSGDFTATKINIAVINNDGNSEIADGLTDYLSTIANIVPIEDSAEKLQDALFFRKVEYILRIPDGFTDGLLSGSKIELQKTVVPDSTSSYYIDFMINKYLNSARLYINNIENITEANLVELVKNDMALNTDVEILNNNNGGSSSNRMYFFNYFAYSLFAVILLGVTSFMMVFNDKDLRRRNLCSPITLRDMNFQMILGNSIFTFAVWFIMFLFSFVIFKDSIFTFNTLYFCLNTVIFAFVCFCISFFVSNFVKSRNAQSAVVNVLALGFSFIGGVFVPQFLLGDTVLKIASFTPTYWYVKANGDIDALMVNSMENIMPIINSMLIQLGFAVLMLIAAFIAVRRKRTSNS